MDFLDNLQEEISKQNQNEIQMLEEWLRMCKRKTHGSMIFGQQLVHFPQLEKKLNSKVKLEEKKNVLKIATENFDLVKRLERVKSAFQPGVLSSAPISHSHRESLKKAYTNTIDKSKNQKYILQNRHPISRRNQEGPRLIRYEIFQSDFKKLAPLHAHVATSKEFT